MQYLALKHDEQVGLLAGLEEMPAFLESAFGSLWVGNAAADTVWREPL